MSAYATHHQSYYGTGRVSSDFPGLARKRRQADDSGVAQIYVSGASGNVTAGKYNDGDPANRPILADRLYQAMVKAWEATERHPLSGYTLRAAPLRLETSIALRPEISWPASSGICQKNQAEAAEMIETTMKAGANIVASSSVA